MNPHGHDRGYPPLYWPKAFWRNSYFGQMIDFLQNRADAAWVKLIGRLRFGVKWHPLIESLAILGVVFMPVMSSWGLLLPLFLLLWITGGPVRNNWAPGAGWLFLWLVLLISAFFSPGLRAGLPVLLRFGSWFALAWLIGRTFSAAKSERILRYLVYSSLIWLSIGFWQLFSGIPTPQGWLGLEQANIIPTRIYSVFGNPNIFALYLLSILIICRYLTVISTVKIEKYLLAGIISVVLVALYFTYTRMAWFLAAVCLGVRFNQNWWRIGLLVAGIITLLLLTFPDFNLRLGSMIHFRDSSLQYRFQIWRGTGQALLDYWLWGAGPGSFQIIYPQYQIGNSVSQHAHQFYLQFWLEHGLFGLLAFFAVLKRVLAGRWLARPFTTMNTLAMAPVIFLIYGFSETWYIHNFSGGYFWFLIGLFQASQEIS